MNFFRSKKAEEPPAAPAPAPAATKAAAPKPKITPSVQKTTKPAATAGSTASTAKTPKTTASTAKSQKVQQTASSQPTKKAAPTQPRQNSGVPLPPEVIAEHQAAQNTPDAGTSQARKRKPRKLGRPSAEAAAEGATPASQPQPGLNQEVEALKSRINQLEGQVEELYNRPSSTNPVSPKPPRRRGRGRGPPPPESLEELQKLEAELEETQKELAALRLKKEASAAGRPGPQPIASSRRPSDEEEVEDIPRIDGPGVETTNQGKSVTLTGSYRIPLPSSVSVEDVKSIQSGINSANNLAKGLMDSHRSQRAAAAQTRVGPNSSTTDLMRTDDKQTWGYWIGGYSMSVAKFVKDIEAEAAIEETSAASSSAQRPRPGVSQRTKSTPASKTPNQASTSGPTKTASKQVAQRPPLKQTGSGSGARLSQQQVETLMA